MTALPIANKNLCTHNVIKKVIKDRPYRLKRWTASKEVQIVSNELAILVTPVVSDFLDFLSSAANKSLINSSG